MALKNYSVLLLAILLLLNIGHSAFANQLINQNGWYTQDGNLIWGYVQHNAWWRAGQRPNITRNDLNDVRPNRTEDLEKLTNNMLQYAYPGFEHNYGLWYDRRRDAHDTGCRSSNAVKPPFLEQPWSRSGIGNACDGLSKYDLTKFNTWYFDRLREFSLLSDTKGTVLFHNYYMQHALLESQTHYVDFPWRPRNTLQATNMPDSIPAANAFYNTSNAVVRDLHRRYIRKVLDEIGEFSNVVHLTSQEYTGPLSFVQFWMDTIVEWENENGKSVNIGISATKDVLDAILTDPQRGPLVNTIDLRYFWYKQDGTLYTPAGGQEMMWRPGSSNNPKNMTPLQVYTQVREYRDLYPKKAIIHYFNYPTRQQSWAFLMAGGSMLIPGQLVYPNKIDPPDYISPEQTAVIQPSYDYIKNNLASILPLATPHDILIENSNENWALAIHGQFYLVYALKGGTLSLDLSSVSSNLIGQWLNPRNGELTPANNGQNIETGGIVSLTAPDSQDWALVLRSDSSTPQNKLEAPINLQVH